MAKYKGLTTLWFQKDKRLSIIDVDVIKQDILNHIFTRKGERVMMYNFGTRIPDITFSPLDDVTLSIIEQDITSVINYDPRLSLIDLVVVPLYDENTVMVFCRVYYTYLNLNGTLDIRIDFNNT
jgi:phage baseplate assembly protein W